MTERLDEVIIENRAMQVRQAWDSVLSTPDGRLVIWSILEGCSLFGQTHYGNDLDGFRAGRRDVGLSILNDRVFPHDARTFASMQIEHAELMDRIQLAAQKQVEKETEDG